MTELVDCRTNGHGDERDRHVVALAEYRTLAEKVRYACAYSPTTASTEMIRDWLNRHGVPTRRTQRSYVSTEVNAWRKQNGLLVTAPGAVTSDSEPVPTPGEHVHRTSGERSRPEGAVGFYLVAAMSMAVSIDTSWRFFGTELGITNLAERGAMFTVLEAALVACGYGMRAGVRRTGRPGPARVWVWALCGLAGYMALVLSGPITGLARVALGPALGLVMLHLALGIEIRAGEHRTGSWARIGRQLRQRVLSRLGLADDDRDALARTRDRAARRVARLCLGRIVPLRSGRLARALRASNVAHDPTARARMLAELAAIRHAGDLATLEQPSPWRQP